MLVLKIIIKEKEKKAGKILWYDVIMIYRLSRGGVLVMQIYHVQIIWILFK